MVSIDDKRPTDRITPQSDAIRLRSIVRGCGKAANQSPLQLNNKEIALRRTVLAVCIWGEGGEGN